MPPRPPAFLALATLLAAVLACGGPASVDTSANARATGLAQTAQFVLTATAVASITPVTDTPIPTFTAVPPAATTAAPPTVPAATTQAPPTETSAPCANNDSAFVSDVNVPDNTHFAGGTVFNKTWRLRNDGECTWTTAYQLRYISGDALGGASVNLSAPVPPGATTDITVSFTAPTTNGTYTSHWQLFSAEGTAFGTKPFVKIIVP